MKNTTLKSIDCKGSIDDVLNEVFKGSNISYVIKGNEVILKVEKTESTQQKKAKIIGIVTDSKTGEPIIGATVQLLGIFRKSDRHYLLTTDFNFLGNISYI